MAKLSNAEHEEFAKQWVLTGSYVSAYREVFFCDDLDHIRILQESEKLASNREIIDRMEEIYSIKEKLKSLATRVGLSDISHMLMESYSMAKDLKMPGHMVRAAKELSLLFKIDPLTKANINRLNSSIKTDEDLISNYEEIFKKLSSNLPD